MPSRKWYSVTSSADGNNLAAVINILSSVGQGGIYTSADGGTTWSLTSAPSYIQSWITISSSTNGANLVAAGAYAPTFSHQVYTSSNFGNTWALTSLPNIAWYSVASSADGTKLVALAWQTNVLYTSADSGTTWVPNTIPNNWW